MKDLLVWLGVSFFGAAAVTLFLVIREALPLLSPEDQITLALGAPRGRANSSEAIFNAWNEHAQSFPHSRKRWMVIAFVVAGIVAFLGFFPLSRLLVK